MKKFSLLLFAVIVMINAAAQQINLKQKVTNENKTAPGDITRNSFLNNVKQRNSIPFLFTSGIENLKSSTLKVKLDSVVVTRTYDKQPIERFFKNEYKYNEQYKLSEIVEKEKDIENSERQWVINRTTSFKYNDAENLIEAMVNSFDKTGITIVDLRKYHYFYNENNKLDSLIAFFIDEEGWKPFINCSFRYNNQGQLIKADLVEFWMGWYYTANSTHNYKYSDDGFIQNYKVTGAYDIFIDYQWNASDNLVNETWNDHSWNQNSIIKYEYNSVGDITKRYSSLYYENQIEEYFYTDVNASEITNYSFSTLDLGSLIDPVVFSPKKQISMIKSWKENGGEWSYSEKSVFFYSPNNLKGEIFTSLNGINQSEICVYPNPATDQITFTWNQNFDKLSLKLFQVTGACVMDKEILPDEKISVKNLQNGMYLYRLSNGNQTIQSGKLVKK